MVFDASLFRNTEAHPQTVASLITFIQHVIGDDKRSRRLRGHDVTVLAEPLRKLLALKPMTQLAGKPWVAHVGNLKLVGDFGPDGILIIRTLYGPGNPVDRRRQSVDITDLLS